MLGYVMQSNMKTHKDGIGGNRTLGPNMARLMVNTMMLDQVVSIFYNHLTRELAC